MADVETPTPQVKDSNTKDETTEKKEGATEAPTVTKEAAEAFNLLAQGKRNMLCGEVTDAVSQLQEACRLLASKFGDTADECADAYLCYGSALLELSRMESGVLGNALDGIDEDEEEKDSSSDDKSSDKSSDDKVEDPEKVSEEEREKISVEVYDAMAEREEEKKAREAKEKEKEKVENGEQEEDKENNPSKANVEANKEIAKDGKDGEDVEMAEDKPEGEKKENGKKDEGKEKAEEKKSEEKEEKMEVKEEEKKGTKEETEGEKKDSAEKKDSSDDKEGDTEEEGTEPESEDIGDEEGEMEAAGDGEADAKEGGSKEGAEKKENEADDDVSNLQLSWEMLELAKLIYSKHSSKEMKLKSADAHLRLGEVGLETEQYEQAIEDFMACLSIQKEFLEAESRLIAETHYQIGVACCHANKYEESISNLKNAVTVIRAKIAKLEKFVEEEEAKRGKGKEPATFDDPLTKANKEIKDLNEILPDILTKIEDTEDEQKSQDKVKQLVKDNLATDFGASASTTTTTGFSGESSSKTGFSGESSSSVNEIKPHLVRKKRKPEEESSTDETKKARQDETVTETNGEKPKDS